MKYFKLVVIVIVSFVPITISSATVINIPDDYTTIQEGIDAGSDGDTVLVQPGTYYENINFNGTNLVLASTFINTGDTTIIYETIIDGSDLGSVVTFENGEDSTAIIMGLNIRNGRADIGGGIHCESASPTITYNYINSNYGHDRNGGGIYCSNSNSVISNNYFYWNSAYQAGGGIFCTNSPVILIGNRIELNRAGEFMDGYGGGLAFYDNSDALVVNCLVYDNHVYGDYWSGGGGILCMSSAITLINCTVTDNTSHNDGSSGLWGGTSSTIINSIIWGNSDDNTDGIGNTSFSNIGGGCSGEGNLDIDPLFRDPENGDFHLMSTECGDPYDSPCIDMGSPSIYDTLLDCSWGLGTDRSDMGAYAGGSGIVDIDEQSTTLPASITLSQNYPNPFNASTIIRYDLPSQSEVSIDIYDILGRHITTLEQGIKQAGSYQALWHAGDVSSGVYFYKLSTGTYSETQKMILIK